MQRANIAPTNFRASCYAARVVENTTRHLTTNIAGLSVIHPVVMVNGRKFRALLDSTASQSYVSSTLVELIGACVVRIGTYLVAMLLA